MAGTFSTNRPATRGDTAPVLFLGRRAHQKLSAAHTHTHTKRRSGSGVPKGTNIALHRENV
jgi:hypothetical protein